MKKLFAFDPNLVAEVRLAGALDGDLLVTADQADSTRSRAVVNVTRWNVQDKVSLTSIATACSVSKGMVQRYGAFGKAVLPVFPEGPVDPSGASEAIAASREASDTIPEVTLNSLLAAYAASVEDRSGSWHGLADFAKATLTEWLAAQPQEEEQDDSEESEEESAPSDPKGPLSVEDYLEQVAQTTLKKAQKEGMAVEKALKLFAEYLFMADAAPVGEEPCVREDLTAEVGAEVSRVFCAGLVKAAERAEKAAA